MAIERSGALVFTARFINHFVVICKSLEEARRSLPELTQEQFDMIRAGKAALHGDSKVGLEYREKKSA